MERRRILKIFKLEPKPVEDGEPRLKDAETETETENTAEG
jgi:hypothetical protein